MNVRKIFSPFFSCCGLEDLQKQRRSNYSVIQVICLGIKSEDAIHFATAAGRAQHELKLSEPTTKKSASGSGQHFNFVTKNLATFAEEWLSNGLVDACHGMCLCLNETIVKNTQQAGLRNNEALEALVQPLKILQENRFFGAGNIPLLITFNPPSMLPDFEEQEEEMKNNVEEVTKLVFQIADVSHRRVVLLKDLTSSPQNWADVFNWFTQLSIRGAPV